MPASHMAHWVNNGSARCWLSQNQSVGLEVDSEIHTGSVVLTLVM